MIKVSVIMPVFNAEKFLLRAINSILNQKYSNFELIIIDDGSEDTSPSIIASIKDSRIKYQRTDHLGIVNALNLALKQSKGKYIARMDADDEAHPERLGIQQSYLDSNSHIDLVGSTVGYLGDKRKNWGYYLHVQWMNSLLEHDMIYKQRFIDAPFAHPSVMFRRELPAKYGEYKAGPFPEDYELWLRWLDQGIQTAKIDKTLLFWRDHPGRLSRVNARYSLDAFNKLKAKYFFNWYRTIPRNKMRPILIWGSGLSTYRKVKWLLDYNLNISGFIDIKKGAGKTEFKGFPVFYFKNIPEDHFILSYVGDRKGKESIKQFLIDKGKIEGINFLMMS